MTDWLEFHDSTLTRFEPNDTRIELLLDAYIHRWEKLGDEWRGTGWTQPVSIVVGGTVAGSFALPTLPVEISDGWLQLGTTAANGIVRLPLQTSGVVRIRLQLSTADVVELVGSEVRIEATAPARYVEDLPLDVRPQEPD